MANLNRPEGLMCLIHSNGWASEIALEYDQQKTACEELTGSAAVDPVIMGSMVALPQARGP